MVRKGKTIYFDEDIFEDLNNSPVDVHDFFNDTYRNEFMSIDKEKELLSSLQKQLKECQERISSKEKKFAAIRKKTEVFYGWFVNGGSRGIQRVGIYKMLTAFNENQGTNLSLSEFRGLVRRLEDMQKVKKNGNN